jgi:hypothetical protein
MDKIRKVILLIGIYFLIFWIGFKSGESHFRMVKKMEEQQAKLAIPVTAPVPEKIRQFYIVEKRFYGTHSIITFDRVNENHEVIAFFLNRKLRPLLKLRDIKIYTQEGDRIY